MDGRSEANIYAEMRTLEYGYLKNCTFLALLDYRGSFEKKTLFIIFY